MFRNTAMYFALLLLPLVSFAQLESQFQFAGQNAETLKMESQVTVTRPVAREVPSTCYRQVPQQTYACRDVTRYRESCSWVPSSQECRTEYEQVCRSVTRYRNECHSGPSRQECRSTSPRTECSDGPSRQECTNEPGREVCVERPTREVCRTKPDGSQVCNTVGGGQHCTTVGGGQRCRTVPGERQCRTIPGERECHTVPGEQICRQVSYQDQDCDSVPRQRCETIPGHNACTDIPYSENVCGYETTYTSEPYACTRTEYVDQQVAKKLSAVVTVAIATNGIVEEFPVVVVVNAKNQSLKEFIMGFRLPIEPKAMVVVKKKSVKVLSETATDIQVEGLVELEMLETVGKPVVFPGKVYEASIEERNSSLEILFKGALPQAGELDFVLSYRGKVISELKAPYPSPKVKVSKISRKDALTLDLKGLMQGRLQSRMEMKLKLSVPVKIEGEVLNTNRPQSEKLYEKVRVEESSGW